MPGVDKAVTRTAAVLALLLLAAVALRGYLPGAAPPAEPQRPDTDGGGSLAAVVAMLTVSLAAIAVSLLARARQPRPARGAGEPFRRASGEHGRIPWRHRLVAAAVLLAWLSVMLLLMRWGPVDVGDPPGPQQQPHARAPDEASPTDPSPGGDGSLLGLLAGATTIVFLLSVAAAVVGRRRRLPPPAAPADDTSPAGPSPAGPDLARAAELGLAEIGDRSRDPREAIIACYVAMEQELGKSPSTVPQASDTPSEVLARAVERRALRADSAAELVDLFEEARFSPHVMNEGHRADAVRALREVRSELQSAT